jgi:hypothetical protein
MNERVVVSRKWANPEITAFVTNIEVGASMSLDDFLSALSEEVGNPTWFFSKAQLFAKLVQAKDHILKEMKDTTKFVI